MSKTCSIEGCEKPSRARGMCPMHYRRFRLYGDANKLSLRYSFSDKEYHAERLTLDNIRQRCNNANTPTYRFYGAKGIKICDRWMGKEGLKNFIEDMGKRPGPEYSIDRIDPRGNYCPENCRWATREIQDNNRTNNNYLTINGITKTATQWAREKGLKPSTVLNRLALKQSIAKALAPSRTVYIEYKGKNQTIKEWSQELGIPIPTLQYRYKVGKRGDSLFAPPSR